MNFDPSDFSKLAKTKDKAEIIRLANKIFSVVDTDKDGQLDINEI